MKGKKMPIVRWDPFSELVELNDEIGRWWPAAKRKGRNGGVWLPDIDIKEDEKQIQLRADLPGMKMEDINVSVDNNQVTISGERKMEKEEKGKDFTRIERSYGAFSRSFDIGVPIKEEEIKASYKDGVLEIMLPKAQVKTPKKIAIKVT
jgi:HSP20 family protein